MKHVMKSVQFTFSRNAMAVDDSKAKPSRNDALTYLVKSLSGLLENGGETGR